MQFKGLTLLGNTNRQVSGSFFFMALVVEEPVFASGHDGSCADLSDKQETDVSWEIFCQNHNTGRVKRNPAIEGNI